MQISAFCYGKYESAFLLFSDMTDAANEINLYLFKFGALIKFSHGERVLTTI